MPPDRDGPAPPGAGAPAARDPALARRTAGNVAAVAGSQLAGKFATLAWLVVAARVLDQPAFGAFSFALALALLVGAVVEWGFSPIMIARASPDPSRLDALYTSAQVWQLVLGAPAYAAAVLVARSALDSPGETVVLVAAVVATAAETWCSTARSAASVVQRQGRVSFALTAQRVVVAAAAVAALVIDGGVVALTLAFLAGTLIGVPLHAAALRRVGVRLSAPGLSLASLRALLAGSHLVGVSGVVLMGLAKLDQVLLGVLDDQAAVGAYAVAYRLLETVFFVAFALRAAIFPILAADPRPAVVAAALRRAWEVLCLAYLPYAVVCLVAPGLVLRLLFGAPYDVSAVSSLRWLAVVPLLFSGAYLLSAALLAVDRQRGVLVAALAALAVTVAADLALIPPLGPAGAAVATVAGYGTQALVCARSARRSGVLPPVLPGLALAVAAALPLVAVVALLPLLPALVVGAPVYLGAWMALVWWWDPSRLVQVLAILPRPVRRWTRSLEGAAQGRAASRQAVA